MKMESMLEKYSKVKFVLFKRNAWQLIAAWLAVISFFIGLTIGCKIMEQHQQFDLMAALGGLLAAVGCLGWEVSLLIAFLFTVKYVSCGYLLDLW